MMGTATYSELTSLCYIAFWKQSQEMARTNPPVTLNPWLWVGAQNGLQMRINLL